MVGVTPELFQTHKEVCISGRNVVDVADEATLRVFKLIVCHAQHSLRTAAAGLVVRFQLDSLGEHHSAAHYSC